MKQEYFCPCCMRTKHVSEFSEWIEDINKARRCDSCLDSDTVKDRMNKADKERDDKQSINPILKKLSEEMDSRRKCIARDRLADIKDKKRIDEEIGL